MNERRFIATSGDDSSRVELETNHVTFVGREIAIVTDANRAADFLDHHVPNVDVTAKVTAGLKIKRESLDEQRYVAPPIPD